MNAPVHALAPAWLQRRNSAREILEAGSYTILAATAESKRQIVALYCQSASSLKPLPAALAGLFFKMR